MPHCQGSDELILNSGFATDTENFGEKVIGLLNDSAMRRQMGINSRTIVENNFTWKRVVEKYIELMFRVCGDERCEN